MDNMTHTPRYNISNFFGLSYASWLVVPRITMEHMSADWQEKMYNLLDELHNEFPNWDEEMGDIIVTHKVKGQFAKLPSSVCQYRYPDKDFLQRARKHA